MKIMRSLFQIISKLPNRFQGNSNLKLIASNTSWLFAERIFRLVIALLINIWVARYLGTEYFGMLNYATAFALIFTSISRFGLDKILVESLSNHPQKKNEILGTAFLINLIGGLVAFLLAMTFIVLINKNDTLIILMVSIISSIGIFQSFNIIDKWFQSEVKSKYPAIARTTAFGIISILKIYLIKTNSPVITFAIATSFEVALASLLFSIIYYFKGHSIWKWKISLPLAKTLMQKGLPLMLSTLSIIIYLQVDKIMIGQISNLDSVGLYSSASRISEVFYFIPTAIASSYAPLIYRAKKNNEEYLYYKYIKQLLRILSFLALFIAIPVSISSKEIIKLLFGNSYIEAAPMLSIHIWAALFVFLGVGASSWFISEELTKFVFIRTFIGAAVNLILNFLLIPTYGGVGAAIATLISYAIGSMLYNGIDKRTRKIFFIQLKSIFFC